MPGVPGLTPPVVLALRPRWPQPAAGAVGFLSELTPHLEIDNFAMGISLVASTRGVALLPATAANFLTWSVVSRPLKGEPPTIDLVVGYHKANTSPILRTFLSRIDELTTRISSTAQSP